jgi:hypothetical protein
MAEVLTSEIEKNVAGSLKLLQRFGRSAAGLLILEIG